MKDLIVNGFCDMAKIFGIDIDKCRTDRLSRRERLMKTATDEKVSEPKKKRTNKSSVNN